MVRAGQAAQEVAAQAAAIESLSQELRDGPERPAEDVLADINGQIDRARQNAATIERELALAGEALASGD
jgi:hypothetical protein